eukprot:XP_001700545.1 predicted protein [Chlamydomonas reinhardtii]
MEVFKVVAGPGIIAAGFVAASYVSSQGFVQAAGVLGTHFEDGLKGHMASEGAGQHLLATGFEHLSKAVKDSKPFFHLLSFGK